MLKKYKRTVSKIIALYCLSFSLAFAAIPDGIEVSLRAVQKEFSTDEAFIVEISYRNTTDTEVRLLKWGTGLESRLNGDILSITHEGNELFYSGLHIKRAPATDVDYVLLKPQSVIRREVDLLTAYAIDLKGLYQIRLRESGRKLQKVDASITLALLSDRLVQFKQTPTVSSCPDGVAGLPSNRFSLIDPAVSAAEAIARQARDALRATPVSERANARRYREWFGIYTLSRWNTLQSHFDCIFDAVSRQRLVFTCEDNESFFAAVFPSRPYEIMLGRAFWSAPRNGTDSKAGTIVHELSHFTILGGTDDIAYGQSAARSLALSNPNGSINNADSHEYFAENTPFLSMPAGSDPGQPTPVVPEPESNRSFLSGIILLLLEGN